MLQQTAQGTLSTLLLPTAGSWLLAACGASLSPPASAVVRKTPVLASVDNFRDMAGVDDDQAYPSAMGQKLRRGVFYRSNALTPTAADLITLNMLGIKAVYDLRTPAEIEAAPDILPSGTSYININIIGTPNYTLPPLASPADTVAMMERVEQKFVTDTDECSRLGQLFTALANGPDTQLYHCTSGKDRTGWVAAVLLTLAGVPQSVIVQDYLLTNTYSAASIQAAHERNIASYGQAYADILYPTLGVQQSFLDAGLEQVMASYGSMNNYITTGLGLSASTQTRLKEKLLG